MKYERKGVHTTYRLTVHIVWITKYRHSVLRERVQLRARDLIKQTCESLDIEIMKGVVSKDHIHLHISYIPKLSVSEIVKRIKGRSGKKLMEEFPEVRKKYFWGGHFWAIGYGAWSSGNITEEVIQKYLEHHGKREGDDNFVLE